VVIGLSGAPGAGKSAAADALRERGCVVLDADREVRSLLQTEDVRDTLASWWGEGVLDEQGEVDRRAVASIVFSDDAERARLERLLHPLVIERQKEQIAEAAARGEQAVVLDAPLLMEAGIDRLCDAVIFVDASRETRLERVRAARGWGADELDRREKSQAPLEKKRSRADYIVNNDGDLPALHRQVRRAFATIMEKEGG